MQHPSYCIYKAEVTEGKRQKVFVAVIFTLHLGNAVMQVGAIKIAVNDLPEKGQKNH